jgi:hypothetical protein
MLTGSVAQAILTAGMGSFVFGYANNAIAGSLVQKSFVDEFLSGTNASSIVGAILGVLVTALLLVLPVVKALTITVQASSPEACLALSSRHPYPTDSVVDRQPESPPCLWLSPVRY